MDEVDHVGTLSEAHVRQSGYGVRRRHLVHSPTLHHEGAVRHPHAHFLIAKLQHAALRSGEGEGNEPPLGIESLAEEARARPARHTAQRHRAEVQHQPRPVAVERLIDTRTQSGIKLAGRKDVLDMLHGHGYHLSPPKRIFRIFDSSHMLSSLGSCCCLSAARASSSAVWYRAK